MRRSNDQKIKSYEIGDIKAALDHYDYSEIKCRDTKKWLELQIDVLKKAEDICNEKDYGGFRHFYNFLEEISKNI